MNTKTQMLLLSQIHNKFDVRTKLDEDRVIQFAGLYQSGVVLPPVEVIVIEEGYAYVDGRHRGAARSYLNLPDVLATILPDSLGDNPARIYSRALKSNWGGAKPPSREDIAHAVTRMLESGATQKDIKEDYLNFLPKGAIDMYIQWAKGVLHKRRITGALDAVAEGMTAVQAAEMFKLKPEVVKDAIQGKKRKWGKDRNEEQQFVIELKAYISKQLKSANLGIGQKMEEVVKRVSNGELTSSAATDIINAWQEHLRKTGIRINDWLARVDSLSLERDRLINLPDTPKRSVVQ